MTRSKGLSEIEFQIEEISFKVIKDAVLSHANCIVRKEKSSSNPIIYFP